MIVVVGSALGALAGALGWFALRGLLGAPAFARANHRGAAVPIAGGLVLVLALVVVAGAEALAVSVAGSGAGRRVVSGALVVATVTGLAVLGLVDDLAGSARDGRGFRGHLDALVRGRLTTGGLKLVGGGALAVAVCAPLSGGAGQLVVDALVVALAANAANLFDRAPGRTLKVAVAAFVVLAGATGLAEPLAGVAVVVGAAAALLPADLGERVMLGDTGANPLGGALGLGVVVSTPPGARVAVLVGLLALNAAGEVVSFSRIIDAVPLLRVLDRAGRRA
ncbi:MAG TPA: hypothetical protein VNT56_08500 [Acidimicrobiales bacterium]|nr:hypothetical protein [Acidimicrobiales bacterium]